MMRIVIQDCFWRSVLMAAVDPDRLTDEQWARLAGLMPGGCKGKRGPRADNRLFMDAVLWMARARRRCWVSPCRCGPR